VSLREFRCASVFFSIIAADAFVSLVIPGLPAAAQAPGAINPGVQLQEQIRDSVPPPRDYESPEQALPDANNTNLPTDNIQSNEDQTVFFKAVRINGNTEFSDEILLQPFLALIGKEITFKQLEYAVLQSESIYKRAGFITTRVVIPAQDLNSGNVSIRVVEGVIEDIDVRGASTGLQAYIRKMLQPIVNDGPSRIFNFKTFERQLLQIRNFGGVKFNSTLAKGNEIGGSLLVIDLTSDSFSGGLGTNNNLPAQLGNWQVSGNLQYITPTSQPVKLFSRGSYAFPYSGGLITGLGIISTPIGNDGFKADALWSGSSTSSKDLFDGPAKVQTIGSSNYWSFGISYPLILKRNSQLSIALKGTGQNSTSDIYIDNNEAFNSSTDKIRAIRLAVDGYYASSRSTNTLSFVLSQGISGLNNELASDEFPSNPLGDSGFTTARLNLSRSQKLFDFGTQLTVKAVGQLSSTALASPEAITYGGPIFGRGFNSVYILGDQGWAGSIELGQQINFSLFDNDISTVTPFAWYDYGDTQNKEGPLPSQTVSTYGLGLRSNAYNINLELGWGIPSSNTLQSKHVGTSHSIVYFNAGWRF
jgi:hemolysin activation/secretion protein